MSFLYGCGKNVNIYEMEDSDYEVRNAVCHLYTRPVEGILSQAELDLMRHWGLIVAFEDRSFRLLEADQVNFKLKPNYEKQTPELKPNVHHLYKLCNIKTSPAKLLHAAQNNPLNNTTYKLMENNCQDWVKACAHYISPSLVTALANHQTWSEIPIDMITRAASSFSSRVSNFSSRSSAKSSRSLQTLLLQPYNKGGVYRT